MSLLYTDINRQLSLSEFSLREKALPKPPQETNSPPTPEEVALSRMIAGNPLLEELVSRLDLVSSQTGKQINKVNTII